MFIWRLWNRPLEDTRCNLHTNRQLAISYQAITHRPVTVEIHRQSTSISVEPQSYPIGEKIFTAQSLDSNSVRINRLVRVGGCIHSCIGASLYAPFYFDVGTIHLFNSYYHHSSPLLLISPIHFHILTMILDFVYHILFIILSLW